MWKNTYNPFSRGGPSSCLHEYASLRMRPINIFTSETMFSLKFQILLLFVELKSLSLLKGLHVLLRVWWIWELGRGWVLSLLTPEITAFHWDLLGTYPEPIPFLFPENSACGVLGPWGSHCSLSNRTSIWDLYDLTPPAPQPLLRSELVWIFSVRSDTSGDKATHPCHLPFPPTSRGSLPTICTNQRELAKLQSCPSSVRCG